MRPVYCIIIITCLYSGISRCQDEDPQSTPVVPHPPASQSATHTSTSQDLPSSSTQASVPRPHEPQHHKETVKEAGTPNIEGQGHGNVKVKAAPGAHGDSLGMEKNPEEDSRIDQTMNIVTDVLSNEADGKEKKDSSDGGSEETKKEEEEVLHSAPSSHSPPPHQHHQQQQQQQQQQPKQQKDSAQDSPSLSVAEEQKEDLHPAHTPVSLTPEAQQPSTAVTDVKATVADVSAASDGTRTVEEGDPPSSGVPEANSDSHRVPEPSSQPPLTLDSSSTTPAPPTQVEPPQPDSPPAAKDEDLDPFPKQPPNHPSPSLAVGSGGMVVDETDLPKVNEEEEVKELTEDFQTFGEWRKKVLEEELEKENEKVKQELSQRPPHAATTVSSQKLRVNFASEKCGAKVVTCNPEMENGNHMLTANKDEYMINPCSAKKWFVIELCEPISVKMVEMASMELFSSQPRSFSLSLTDRYPTKEWVAGGKYEMTADKMPQLFHLQVTSPYVKFLRVEMLDHYGSEHFCPVTLFRVFGVPMEEDDDDNMQHTTTSEEEQGEAKSETLFAKTKATVVSLVKKVLYKDQEEQQQQQQQGKAGEGGLEKHANFSGDEALPCDPEVENQRLPEKTIEGTLVTVHQPQPTVHAVHDTADSTASSAATEVPMVTKLNEGEQLEIEEKSKRLTPGGQELVTLLESGRAVSWERALHLCNPAETNNVSGVTCSFNRRCLYVQVLLGTPPPFSLPRSSIPAPSPPPSSEERLSSASQGDLEPSFSSPVSHLPQEDWQSRQEEDGVTFTDVHVQSSSEVSTDLQSTSSLTQATSIIPDHLSATTAVTTTLASSPSSTPQDRSQLDVGPENTQPEESGQATVAESSTPAPPKRVTSTGPLGHVVETDPGTIPSSSTSEPAAESSTEVKSGTPMEEKEGAKGTTSTPASKPVSVEVVLQPSVQMDTTSVQSPTLARPTPVLETSGASVSMQGDVEGEGETGTPTLSPSPTSHTAEPGQDSAAFPQIIEPTMQGAEPIAQSQDPQTTKASTTSAQQTSTIPGQKEEAVVQNKTQPAASNDTEKKEADLGLVTVPLTLSAKRESAVMRLTNRIKALELNVSLSSRFLEELSTRFKKQNEEMMKMLNKTMTRLNFTATVSQRQVAQHEQRLDVLETRLENLTQVVQRLSESFDSFTQQMSDRQMIFTTFNLLVLIVSLVIYCRAMQTKALHPDLQFLLDTMPRRPPPPTPFPRRNSDVALPLHHVPDLPMASARKKGGSMANLAGPVEGGGLLFLDKGELGPKKKKRKKSRGQKLSAADMETIGAESDPGSKLTGANSTACTVAAIDLGSRAARKDSISSTSSITGVGSGMSATNATVTTAATTDPNHRTSCIDSSKNISTVKGLGHRRCGSATASFFSLAEPPPAVATPCQPPPGREGGREVQFCIGGQVLPEASNLGSTVQTTMCGLEACPVSLPYSLPSIARPSSSPSSIPFSSKPPVLAHSQRSKSLTTSTNSLELDEDGGTGPVSKKEETLGLRGEMHVSLPPPGLSNSQPHTQPTSMHKVSSVCSKPKKAPAVVNGERESKIVNFDPTRASQRKGSFRGSGVGEEGRGGGYSKVKGSKKPGRIQSFEKA